MSDLTSIDPSLLQPAPAAGTAAGGSSDPAQLKVLAAQFEAMLMSQMLKQMQSSMFDDEETDGGFAKGPLAEAMYSELSLVLSRAGGVGVAASMMGPLLRQTHELDPRGGSTLGDLSAPAFSLAAPDLAARAFDPTTFSGPVSSNFGWRRDPINGGMKFHKGADIAMPIGQEVPVARAGSVSFAGEQQGYGLTVVVDHGPGLSTRYAHLSEVTVQVGDEVAEGQTIAKSGASGRVTGPHLHFEVLEGGQPVDPALRMARLGAAVRSRD